MRLRKRRNAVFRASQRRELERAQQLRTRAMAKRGIKKFSAKKPTKPHTQAHPHAAHHKLPSKREHIHPHHHLVERREGDQGQGRQQGGGDPNQQQQQGEQQERQDRRAREEQQQDVELGSRKPRIRASARLTTKADAHAADAVKPSPTSIQEAVAKCRNPEQAEEVLLQRYFDDSMKVFDEADRLPSPPPTLPETQTAEQRRNLLRPLKLFLPGNPLLHRRSPENVQSIQKAIEQNEALRRVVSLSPSIDQPSARARRANFTEELLRVDNDLLEALRRYNIAPVVDFDRIKPYLSERTSAKQG